MPFPSHNLGTVFTPTTIYEAVFLLFAACYLAIIWWLCIHALQSGSPIGVFCSFLCASIIPMALVTSVIENRPLDTVFNLNTGSWQFILGDSIVLPLGGSICALAWKRRLRTAILRPGSTTLSPTVLAPSALLIGFVAGFGFHYLEAGVYTVPYLHSPSKLIHDLVAYPILVGAIIYAIAPGLFSGWMHDKVSLWLTIIGGTVAIGGWIALGIINHHVDGPLSPTNLHVPWDWTAPIHRVR